MPVIRRLASFHDERPPLGRDIVRQNAALRAVRCASARARWRGWARLRAGATRRRRLLLRARGRPVVVLERLVEACGDGRLAQPLIATKIIAVVAVVAVAAVVVAVVAVAAVAAAAAAATSSFATLFLRAERSWNMQCHELQSIHC